MSTSFDFNSLLSYAHTHQDALCPLLSTQKFAPSDTNPTTRSIKTYLNKRTIMLVDYYPSILETCKFNWARYLAFAIIFYYLLSTLLKLLLKEGLLDSQTIVEKVK